MARTKPVYAPPGSTARAAATPQTMHPADLEATLLTAMAWILTDARGDVVAARPLAAATDSEDTARGRCQYDH